MNRLFLGDCREVLALWPEDSIDCVVTDPPYEINFMAKSWDRSGVAFDPETWRAILRVMKPGAHLVAFAAPRTSHRITCAIEDAGFEIRDSLMWLFGSGFPKSMDVSKALDKALGAEREIVGTQARPKFSKGRGHPGGEYRGINGGHEGQTDLAVTEASSPEARRFARYGTALKPAYEPIILARKPLIGTVASNVLEHGTGGINIDGCRIKTSPASPLGRWPANLILDETAGEILDAQAGPRKSGARAGGVRQGMGYHGAKGDGGPAISASVGGPSRFFYCAKASKADRDFGCESLLERTGGEATGRQDGSVGVDNPRAGAGRGGGRKNTHPTVKPTDLMRWLVRLVAPPGGLVLDPFMGSGSTGVAAIREGLPFAGIEHDQEFLSVAAHRIDAAEKQ